MLNISPQGSIMTRKLGAENKRDMSGKYSFLNRIIRLWNRLPADAWGTLSRKPSSFKEKVGKLIHQVK
jgi:hypothetical protein